MEQKKDSRQNHGTGQTRGTVSRRDFLGLGGIAATSGILALSGCAAAPAAKGSAGEGLDASKESAKPAFMQAPEPITDIAETKDYDVVVVGAGASGIPAALSANEKGAAVALLQKESRASSNGNTGTGIDLANSDPAGVEALIALLIKDCNYRSNRALVEKWAYRSGEAVKWVIEQSLKGDATVIDQKNAQAAAVTTVNGYTLNYVTSYFGPKPYTTGDGMVALASVAEKAGVEILYSTPAVQLVVEGGAVTAVIAKGPQGYIRLNAKKGVILATGDYQNNEEICEYYLPDVRNFGRKQIGRTGDGHMMGLWAGAVMEPIGHTKMLHDFDAGPASMCDMPFLAVTEDGKRFCNEETPMSILNNFLKEPIGSKTEGGWYSQVFDSSYMEQAQGWPGGLVPPEGLVNYMPEEPGEKKGVLEGFIRTFKADTIDELAKKIETDPTELKKTIARYNELVEKGTDDDFGKQAKFLKPIVTPPFYGIHRWLRISALCSGLVVDENGQCLDAQGQPIKGLFAVGNTAGSFYAGVDYPMTLPGYNLGHCYTQGRVTGQYVAGL
ncbi:MAG: FAD-dependent oxidoreductase [Coriobacteriaceae bacterium]|nr:FAD-dependent oxidoreductase [Coriobacteriaceae bacterium]